MNNDIALFKFIYSWFIVFYHFDATHAHVEAGYFGVEFYLIVAGVFFFQSYEKQLARGTLMTPGTYCKKRFSRLFPWAFTAFLFTAAVMRRSFFLHEFSLPRLLSYLSDDIWEILLVKWNGMNEGGSMMLNVPAWTMSSLLIVGVLLWAVLYHYDKKFLHVFMPLTLIIGYGIWRHLPEASTGVWIGFTTVGTFRTYLAMCLGYYAVQLSKKLSAISFNRLGEWLLSLCELCCHAMAFVIMLHCDTRNFQWLTTLLFFVAVAIALSGKSRLCQLLNQCHFISYLQDLSLSVYLVHIATFEIFTHFFGDTLSGLSLAILVGMILVCAAGHFLITRYLVRLAPDVWKRFMKQITHADV